MPPFNWNDLRFFLAMARKGSPTAAARHLKVDHTTVRRRITALEDGLKVRLFEPRDRGFFLTPAGEQLLKVAESIETISLAGESSIAGQDTTLSGSVRVGAPDGLGSMFLAPHLTRFALQYPALQIELDASSRIFNLAKREADIAITIALPKKGRQVVRKLTDCRMHLYASAEYLETHPKIQKTDDLKEHQFVGYFEDMPYAHEFNVPEFMRCSRYAFQSTNFVALYQAASAGAGICLMPSYMFTEGTTLRPVLRDKINVEREIWMTTHSDLKDIARFRGVADFIVKTVAQQRHLFIDP